MKKTAMAVIITAFMLSACITSYGYELPQKYSTEEFSTIQEIEEEMENIEIPEYVERTYMDVWVNDGEVILPHEPVKRGKQLYIPAETFFRSIGMEVSVKNGKVSVKGESDGNAFSASFKAGSKKLEINGENVKLEKAPKYIKGYLMVNTEIIAKMLNAKVWLDEDGNSLVISTGKYKNDEKMRIIAGKFYMNGEPYYEISFNKWNLYLQIEAQYTSGGEWSSEERQKAAAEEALSILHENGFKSIRFFCNHSYKGEKYLKIMDEVLDLCDKYDIKVVPTLQIQSSQFVEKGEDYWDLMCNADSKSRQNLYEFLDEFIGRYKDRKTILMWEIMNEGNLSSDVGYQTKSVCISIRQLGNFYADCAKRIKMTDPDRPITTGDSELRDAQWHLYRGIREGYCNDWTQDTLE